MSAAPTSAELTDPYTWVELLADEIGPRRPTGQGERIAAHRAARELTAAGLSTELQEIRGFPTFAAPLGAISALAVAPALIPRRGYAGWRALAALLGPAALLAEADLKRTPLSDLMARRASQNVVATIEPTGETERTVCLMCHLDTSRSGLLFDPRFSAQLIPWLKAIATAIMVQGAEPLLGRSRFGAAAVRVARVLALANLGLLAERELRGEDVPGANDNASGVGVVGSLALGLARAPLEHTRVVVLMTGCEEAGLLGAHAFLRSRPTDEWLFLNFDCVGGPGDLLWLEREGVVTTWPADSGLRQVAARLAEDHPELKLAPARRQVGLTYDATPVLARGGRALTLVAAGPDGSIPNYHWPSDTPGNVDRELLARAHETARLLLERIDRGEADRRRADP